MLDIIQHAVELRRWATCRIDGSMTADDRAKEVARFRRDAAVPLFLLSSQVRGPALSAALCPTREDQRLMRFPCEPRPDLGPNYPVSAIIFGRWAGWG